MSGYFLRVEHFVYWLVMGREDFIIRLLKTEQLRDLEFLIVALMNFLILWDVNSRLATIDISNIISA